MVVTTPDKSTKAAHADDMSDGCDDDDLPDIEVPVSHRRCFSSSPHNTEGTPSSTEQIYKKGPGGKSSNAAEGTHDTMQPRQSLNLPDRHGMGKKKTPAASASKPSDLDKQSSHSLYQTTYAGLSKSGDCNTDKTNDTNEDWYNAPSRSRKKSNKDNSVCEIMQQRSHMFERVSRSVESLSEYARKPVQEDSADTLWAKSLVLQMSRMEQTIKDKFMVFVYQVAIDAINGKEPGTYQ